MAVQMFTRSMMLSLLAIAFTVEAAVRNQRTRTTTTPNWFQTTPNSYAGPFRPDLATPFLAQTNPAPFGQVTYVANAPLGTSEPIVGAHGRNIFHLMGNLSTCFPAEDGFGFDEYSLPEAPTADTVSWASGIVNATANGTVFEGDLSFLNDWSYKLGGDLLVPQGRKELFESGLVNYYNYGHLMTIHPSSSSGLLSRPAWSRAPPRTSWQVSSGSTGLSMLIFLLPLIRLLPVC
ncbi:hypothetical protein V1506DRAFT_581221 [Lipomyces tetrasporus]